MKAHGWVKISIGMIKLCSKAVATSWKLIFRSMVEVGVFSMTGKKQCSSNPQKTPKTWLKIIDLSAFYPFSVKFLKDLYLIPCSIILYKTKYSLSVSLA